MEVLLPQLVATHAARSPGADAVVCGDDVLSWDSLDKRVNQLANSLRRNGVHRGFRVGIYMDKSVQSAIAMYAIMRCGAAYVPLDPGAPVSRIASIIRDCSIRHLISRQAKRTAIGTVLAEGATLDCIVGMDEDGLDGVRCINDAEIAGEDQRQGPAVKVLESDLAYIIYTSGSTGTPKGIMHTHYSSLSFSRWAAREYELRADDRVANHAPLHFDLSIFDYFAAAVAGACTVIVPEEYTRLPASYSALLADQRVSVFFTVPFALIQLLARGVLDERDLGQLRWIIFGGEPYPAKHLRGIMDQLPHVRFDNMYGPAEVNGCTHFTLPANFSADDSVPIGPICAIAESLIVDDEDRVVAPGETGELLVRTPTMMQGYWARDDLNAGAFFRRQVEGIQQVFYRTGDLVTVEDDGIMHFVGRKDRQVKVRGYRIELDEIEAALTGIDGVQESAVIAVPDLEGSKKLIAAVLLNGEPRRTGTELVAALKSRIPRYAIPAKVDCRQEFPRTTTGKIDRQQLSREYMEMEAR